MILASFYDIGMKWPTAGLLGRVQECLPSPQGVCPHACLECILTYFGDYLGAEKPDRLPLELNLEVVFIDSPEPGHNGC